LNRKLINACSFVADFAGLLVCMELLLFSVEGSVAHADSHQNPIRSGNTAALPQKVGRPIVIAHRGASGFRPEHTLSAYELALVQGADFIELDLVATADGVLISRHENALAVVALDGNGRIRRGEDGSPEILEATTDVAGRPEFSDRLTVKRVDGRLIGGWFSEDFTLEEIRALKARERMPSLRPNNQLYDDREGVPTLADVIDLVRRWEAATGAQPGLYIELKHPTFFLEDGRRLSGQPIGLDLVGLLLDGLMTSEFTDSGRVFIQCFEVWPLLDLEDRMRALDLDLPLIQLYGDIFNRRYRAVPRDLAYYASRGDVTRYGELTTLLGLTGDPLPDLTYADLARPDVLAFIAGRYADGIGPPRSSVLKVSPPGDGGARRITGEVEPFLSHARSAGLLIHPYTLRAERPFLFAYEDRPLTIGEEARMLIGAGVDGFFIDQPSEGRLAVDGLSANPSTTPP